MKYVTLVPEDKRLPSYLDGYDENQYPAVRVVDANEAIGEKHITFRLLKQRPKLQWKTLLIESNAPTLVLIVLLPLVFVCLAAEAHLLFSRIALLIIGVMSLLASASTWSEVRDYRTGWDLANPVVASKSWLYQGAISSRHLLYISYLMFIVAIGSALLLVKSLPVYVWLWPLIGWGLVITWVWYPFQLKYRKGGEIILFILFGPLLTSGIAIFLQQELSAKIFIEGGIWGGLATLFLQQKRFLNLMGDTRSGKLTTLVHLGFDLSKLYFIYMSVALVVFASAYLIWYQSWWLALIYIVWVGFFQYKAILLLKKSHSPLGKSFYQINQSLNQMVKSQLIFWVGLAFFSFWIWSF